MRNCRCFAACLAVVLGTAKALLAPQLAAAESISTTRVGSQVAVLFSGQAILGRQLPAFMQIQPGRLLNARTVEHACWAPGLRADGVLLFLPDSQHCELISPSRQISLRFRLQQLTGHWPLSDVTARIRNQPFVAIAPTGHTLAQATNVCGCLDNAPPDAIAMCSAQTRTAGTAIGQVAFIATDADSPSLTSQFNYQLDSGTVQTGLPPPLSASCQPGAGTLQCTVDGLAPGSAGIFQLSWTVSDGTSTAPASSLINVLAVGDRVFADSFDPPGCP